MKLPVGKISHWEWNKGMSAGSVIMAETESIFSTSTMPHLWFCSSARTQVKWANWFCLGQSERQIAEHQSILSLNPSRWSSWRVSPEQPWWRWETATLWTVQSLTSTTTSCLDRNWMCGELSVRLTKSLQAHLSPNKAVSSHTQQFYSPQR